VTKFQKIFLEQTKLLDVIAKLPTYSVSVCGQGCQGRFQLPNKIKKMTIRRKECSMACARCGGLIVQESVYDREGSSQVILMDRCLQCGHIEDPVSARNRAQISQSPTEKGKARRDPEHPFPPIQLAKG
jgi:hypothetical protein